MEFATRIGLLVALVPILMLVLLWLAIVADVWLTRPDVSDRDRVARARAEALR
jgi:hypothetical protein